MHELGEDYYQAMVLAGVAGLLAAVDVLVASRGPVDAAVRILAALARLREEDRIIGAPRDIKAQDRLRSHIEQAAGPEAFQTAWSAGNSLTLDDAVALARSELRHVRDGS